MMGMPPGGGVELSLVFYIYSSVVLITTHRTLSIPVLSYLIISPFCHGLHQIEFAIIGFFTPNGGCWEIHSTHYGYFPIIQIGPPLKICFNLTLDIALYTDVIETSIGRSNRVS